MKTPQHNVELPLSKNEMCVSIEDAGVNTAKNPVLARQAAGADVLDSDDCTQGGKLHPNPLH